VAAAVRLLHRRHGWAVVAVIGIFGFFLGDGTYANANAEGAPAPNWFVYMVTAFAALMVSGIVAYIVESVRLRHTPPEVRTQAAQLAAHHPRGPRAHHYPPRHAVTWALRWIGMALFLVVAVVSVPAMVDGVAFLTGAEKTVTFNPTSYQANCDRYTCATATDGTLETGGAGVSASWSNVVPLGKPFQVREPVWRWGLGLALINSDGIAVTAVLISLLIEGVGVLVVIRIVQLARNWRRHRQQQVAGAFARIA
jgi:hypothetical protein